MVQQLRWPLAPKLVFALVMGLAAVPAPLIHAQTFSVLYTFTAGPSSGTNPFAGVVLDASGNVYGMTDYGGSGLWCPTGCGVVFKVASGGQESILHNFSGNNRDGASPTYNTLTSDGVGDVYGTTYEGGSFGAGTIFAVTAAGQERVLYSFTGATDGGFPYGGLIHDSAGNFYGTTSGRGSGTSCPYGCGTVFKLDSTGKETVLYNFLGGTTDGAYPLAGVIRDSAGNLYGTTQGGGTSNLGTVFKIDTSGNETVLHSFTGPDGSLPYGGLIRDGVGNLYGTTYSGGFVGSQGTVFKLAANGTFTLLHSFTFNGVDGAFPTGSLVADSSGNLYGTTLLGGSVGAGTVFELDSNGNETILHSFTYSTDGGYPYGSLARDSAGNLYGTTNQGGDPVCLCGTVYKIVP